MFEDFGDTLVVRLADLEHGLAVLHVLESLYLSSEDSLRLTNYLGEREPGD